MIVLRGRCSQFGGRDDEGMKDDDGLSLYEPWQADTRPDLFHPALSLGEQTWKRLDTDAPYIALRFDHNISKSIWRRSLFRIINDNNGRVVTAWLVDWGPGEDTNRVVDVSPSILKCLGLNTDDEVLVKQVA